MQSMFCYTLGMLGQTPGGTYCLNPFGFCFIQAFAGAHGVFLVTEAGFGNPEAEVQQGKNAADAAKEVRNICLCMATAPSLTT